MGFLNRVGPQGFVTEDEGPNQPTVLVLEQHKGHVEANHLYVDPQGTVLVGPGDASGSFVGVFSGTLDGLASSVKYEFHSHTGSQVIPIDPLYSVVQITNNVEGINSGISFWDPTNHVFKPTQLGTVYTLRLTGETGPTDGSGNQVLHFDLALSGTNMTGQVTHSATRRHYQGIDIPMRSNQDDVDVHAIFTLFTDQDLITSGAQIFMNTTSNAGLQLRWTALMIKEG